MSGQTAPGGSQMRVGAPAVSQQPFMTMWPSYYANGVDVAPAADNAAAPHPEAVPVDSSQADVAEALQREREQRIQKRKMANRESAKRSKLKRQQAERELQDHARHVDEERDSLTTQLATAQQRYAEVHARHHDLRRKIQSYVDDSGGSGATGSGPGG